MLFQTPDLFANLKSRDVIDLVFTEMMTQMCIDATVRAAEDYGFGCTVVGDACATRDLEINGSLVIAEDVHKPFLAGLSF